VAAPRPAKLDPVLLERARRSLTRRDPVLGLVIRRVGPCRLRPLGDPYRQLLRSVIYQQLQGRAAAAIAGRLRARHGGRFPAAPALLASSDGDLREVGLSRQKITALRNVAAAFADGSLDNRRLYRMDDAAVIEAVTKLHGIGEWTAHMLLLVSLGRPDVLPVGDYGVRKAALDLYRLRELPKPRELEALGERWRPWRSVAAWYLWRHTDVAAPDA
jgi:DNA-3-methyladenine glycosylase II